MNEQDKDLAAFEEYLFSFMNEATASTPLTDDEVVAILENYGPPEEISLQEKEQAFKRMSEARRRRMEVADKMQNPDQIQSLGELFKLFCEWKQIPSAWLAQLLNMSEGYFEAHLQDRVSPEELEKEQILNFAAVAGIGVQALVTIIERTLKARSTNLITGQTKIYKKAVAPQLSRIMDSPTQVQPKKMDEVSEPAHPIESWEALREAILQQAEKDAMLLNQPHQCLTIRDESQRQYVKELLQQI